MALFVQRDGLSSPGNNISWEYTVLLEYNMIYNSAVDRVDINEARQAYRGRVVSA